MLILCIWPCPAKLPEVGAANPEVTWAHKHEQPELPKYVLQLSFRPGIFGKSNSLQGRPADQQLPRGKN